MTSWLDTLASFAHSQMTEDIREELWGRGVTDDQIDLYQIGYLDRDFPDLGDDAKPFMEWSENGSKLDEAISFPLTNTLGQVKGFQFRHVQKSRPGYMDFWLDRSESVLFGLGQAIPHIWETSSVWLVEGAFDLFPIQRSHPNIVTTLTAAASQQLVRVLRRLASEVWLGWDSDSAGDRGAEDFAKYHKKKFERIYRPRLPQVTVAGKTRKSKDPGELWESLGEERFKCEVDRIVRNCRCI
jgi:DNA primase